MTDKEFQRLKHHLHKKITEVHAMQKLYRDQTGREYVVSGSIPELDSDYNFYDLVSCLIAEGSEFMTKAELYDAIEKEHGKIR